MKNCIFRILFVLLTMLINFYSYEHSLGQEARKLWWHDRIEYIKENDTLFMEIRSSDKIGIEAKIALLNLDSNDMQLIIENYKNKYLSAYELFLTFERLSQEEINYVCKSIQKSRLTDALITSLTVNDCTLDSLPFIYEFRKVEEIHFFNSEVKSISRISFKDLITINSNYSFMNGFPKGFEKLDNIIELKMDFKNYGWGFYSSISSKPITVDYYDELQKFRKKKNLRLVSIRGIDFNKYPEYLIEFPLLNYLSIECSNLVDLPELLKKRQNEITFDVSATSIKNIPDWVTNLDYNIKFWVNKEQRDLNKVRFKHNLYWDGADFGNRRVSLLEIINDTNDE